MAFHNSTPQSVLDAPALTPVVIEGTEFTGANRQHLRAVGHRGSFTRKGAGSAKTGSPEWFLAMKTEVAMERLDTVGLVV